MTKTISSKLPQATLSQRLASMSETQLAFAARKLAQQPEQDMICTAVLNELERRISGETFEAFVSEIYS
jgi:hypothetical protein